MERNLNNPSVWILWVPSSLNGSSKCTIHVHKLYIVHNTNTVCVKYTYSMGTVKQNGRFTLLSSKFHSIYNLFSLLLSSKFHSIYNLFSLLLSSKFHSVYNLFSLLLSSKFHSVYNLFFLLLSSKFHSINNLFS